MFLLTFSPPTIKDIQHQIQTSASFLNQNFYFVPVSKSVGYVFWNHAFQKRFRHLERVQKFSQNDSILQVVATIVNPNSSC